MATSLANTPPRQATIFASRGALARLLRGWHLASLDAPSVAVVWAAAFAWSAHVRLPAWPLPVLALAVWAIYVGDRLLDARAGLRHGEAHELRERHYFHWRHRRLLLPLAALAAAIAAWIVRLRMPAIALPQDSAVAAATLAYFSGVHSRKRLPRPVARMAALLVSRVSLVSREFPVSREFLVGLLFSAGCVLPAWSAGRSLSWQGMLLPAGYFSVLAWLNVRAITLWEAPSRGSWVKGAAWGLAAVGAATGCALLPAEPRAAALLLAGAASAAMIAWLDRRREAIDPVSLRALVDVVLLTPVLLLAAGAR